MIPFRILTPGRTIHDDTVDVVSLPTSEGEITILPHHIPLVTALRAGVVTAKRGKEERYFSVSTGIVKVDASGVVILADTAEKADELLEEQIEKARVAAQTAMTTKHSESMEFTQALAALERETARMRALRRFRRTSGGSTVRSFSDSES